LIQQVGKKYNIRTDVPYKDLSEQERKKVMYGTGTDVYSVQFVNEQGRQNTYNSKFEGVIHTLTRRYFDNSLSDKGIYDDYVTNIECPDCNGHRLNSESLSIFLG
jgi:excinuclease ABC subunit A